MTSLSRKQFLTGAAALAAASTLPAGASRAQSGPMNMKPIPKTGEMTPVIGLGTNRFGRLESAEDKARGAEVIRALVGGGASVVDTAEAYGASEAVLGEIFESTGTKDQVFMATKVYDNNRESAIAKMENSFKNLRTDVIDLMMVHSNQATEQNMPVIQDWKQAGRFRYAGISHSNAETQGELVDEMINRDLDIVQLKYSVNERMAEDRLLPTAADQGVAVMANVPLGRGSLLEQVQGQDVPEWAREELMCDTFAQLLLKFVISHPAVTVAIPGTTTPRYMVQNCIAGQGPLADEKQRKRIAAIWDA